MSIGCTHRDISRLPIEVFIDVGIPVDCSRNYWPTISKMRSVEIQNLHEILGTVVQALVVGGMVGNHQYSGNIEKH